MATSTLWLAAARLTVRWGERRYGYWATAQAHSTALTASAAAILLGTKRPWYMSARAAVPATAETITRKSPRCSRP
jgi:hypothetical protein